MKTIHIKRALGASVVAYIASFIIGTIIAIAFGIDFSETQEIPALLWYTGAFVSIGFAGAAAWWYFRSPKIIPSTRTGLYFGLIMIATGFILDFVTLLPLFTHENPLEPILGYYLAPMFWVTLVLVMATTTITGKYKGSQRRNESDNL